MDIDAILDAETVLVNNSCLAFAIMSKDNVGRLPAVAEQKLSDVRLRLFYRCSPHVNVECRMILVEKNWLQDSYEV